jgi:hypothetical protein
MTRAAVLVTASLVVAACGSDSPTSPPQQAPPSNTITFTAALSAANEVPPVTNADANARGTATITFNVTRDGAGNITGGSANFTYTLNGFPAGSVIRASHIHEGASGVAGGVRVDTGLTPATAVTLAADGTGTLSFSNVSMSDAALVNSIVSNPAGYYFNVHSNLNPGGAVRGQLVRQ